MDEPWILTGDYNVTVHPSKSSNCSDSHMINSDMQEFIDARLQLSVFDHVHVGPKFTWTNKHQEGFLARKLDRVLINNSWSDRFPPSHVEFLCPEVSDHCPGLILLQQEFHSPPKPFKFFNF